MKKLSFLIILFFLISFSSISDCIAFWSGPVEVFSATWGKADGQLGYESGDTSDSFPMSILVTDDQRIIIGDIVNNRIVIIKNGRFYKAFRPSALPADSTMTEIMQWTTLSAARFLVKLGGKYQIYNTEGILLRQFEGIANYIEEVVSLPDDSIIVHTFEPNSYYHYTSDGTLLKTYSVEPQEVKKLRVVRHKIIESVSLPKESHNTEFGAPVVAPNGDVYFWEKTPFSYSIKKLIQKSTEKIRN